MSWHVHETYEYSPAAALSRTRVTEPPLREYLRCFALVEHRSDQDRHEQLHHHERDDLLDRAEFRLHFLIALGKRFAPLLYRFERHLRTLPSDNLQLLVLKLVRGNEELFQLFLYRLRQVSHVTKSLLEMRLAGHRK